MQKSNITDVAKLAGVSVATVSRAFSHPQKLAPTTLARVRKAAEQLNFTISRSPAALRNGQSFRIAFLVASNDIDWFTAHILEGLNDIFQPSGYDVVMYPIGTMQDRENFFKDLPVRNNADAVIVSSFDISAQEVQRLNTMHVPIVGINIASTEGFDASISIDDNFGMTLAVKHLYGLGHRRIAYVFEHFTSQLHFSSIRRLQAFQEACMQYGDVQNTIIDVPNGASIADVAYTKRISQGGNAFTALCLHQDSLAIPLLINAHKYGVTIPQQISIIGYDNGLYAQEVGLTTIGQNPRDMAHIAAQKTLQLMQGKELEVTHEIYPVTLVVRNSTSAIG